MEEFVTCLIEVRELAEATHLLLSKYSEKLNSLPIRVLLNNKELILENLKKILSNTSFFTVPIVFGD